VTLAQLASFVRIAELGSLSKAAASLRVAQPALSRQVRTLEEELNAALLIRHAWGVSTTPAGEALLSHARQILRETEAARSAVEALSADPAGLLVLGVPSSLATVLLPVLAERIGARYPRLRLHLMEGYSATLHQWALSGRLDLAVMYDDPALGPLPHRPFLTEPLVAVGPPGRFRRDEAVGAQALAGERMILPARPNRLRLLVEDWAPGMEGALEVDSVPALHAMMRAGAGCTILPYSAVHAAVSEGLLSSAPLAAPGLTRTLVLARPPQRAGTPAQAAVEAELDQVVRDMAPSLGWTPLGA
jgi:LysR family nitrogen assimilation transcriptional regulator